MPVARLLRLLTLALSFASLQLALLAGGPGCSTPSAAVGGGGPAAMAGMGGSAMEVAGRTGNAPAAREGEPAAPCGDAAAPQSCPTMAPCLFAVLVPVAHAEMPTTADPASVVVSVVLTPPSTTSSPAIPPPRA